LTPERQARLDALDLRAELARSRALMKRQRQFLTLEDVRTLLELRALRLDTEVIKMGKRA